MKYLILTFILAAICLNTSFAQYEDFTKDEIIEYNRLSNKHLNFNFGASFISVNPTNDFKTYIGNKSGYGLSTLLAYRMDSLPISMGVKLDYCFFQSQIDYENDAYANVQYPLNYLYETMPVNLFVRLEPNDYITLIPYCEVSAGINFIEVADVHIKGAQANKTSKTAFNYTVGGGMQFLIVDVIDLFSSTKRVYFDFGLQYSGTSPLDFEGYKNEGLKSDNQIKYFKSDLNNISLKFGLSFHF